MSVIPTQDNLQMTDAGLIGKSTPGVGLSGRMDAAAIRAFIGSLTQAQIETLIAGAIAALVDSSPGTLDTLNELAAALGDDPNFATTTAAAIAAKYTKPVSGIPSSDLSASVQTSLGLADTALQSVPNETIDDRVAALLVAGTNITITYNDAANTLTIAASGGSPGGSSGQVQFNSAGSFGGAAALSYAATGTHLAVTALSATAVPLCAKGAASQTGNLFEAQSSAGAIGARVTATQRFSHCAPTLSQAEQFGDSSSVQSHGSAFGFAATTQQFGAAFGQSAFAGQFCTALGRVAGTSGTSGGIPSTHAFTRCITIADGTDFYSPTASNQLHIAGEYTEGFFGQQIRDAAPTASIRLQGCGATGTNIAGTSIIWAAGRGTGSATPAAFTIQTTTAGSSGTTLQTLRDALQLDGNTTSGETPMLLLDCAKGTLQRVSIGASDSGGTGFKVLRVPN